MVDFPFKKDFDGEKIETQNVPSEEKIQVEEAAPTQVSEYDELVQKYLSPEEILEIKKQKEAAFKEPPTPLNKLQNLEEVEIKPQKKPSVLKLIVVGVLVLSFFFGGLSVWSFYRNQDANSSTADKFNLLNVIPGALKAATNNYVKLKGQDEGRTNFLIYGLTLDEMRTDTIMLVSYYHKEKKFVTLNIPRDLYQNDGFKSEKLVSVYTFAKVRQPNDPNYPAEFLSSFLAKEFGVPIHYWGVVSMAAFKDLIDQIGGVEVSVENSFKDDFYPKDDYSGNLRPSPSFQKGLQQMDGTRALIYARSRKSLDNGEGSDFARGKRQAIVIQAALSKVKSKGILENVGEINNYLSVISKYVRTNMTTDEMLASANLGKGLNPTNDVLIANWSYENGFICDGKSPIGQDILLYGTLGNCGVRMGGGGQSKYRDTAISYVQNLLKTVQNEAFYKTPVVILGNQSNDTDKAEDSLLVTGFKDLNTNNNYKRIKEATSTSIETTTIYISNPDIKKSFEEVASGLSLKYELKDTIPADLVLPKDFNSNKQILIWVG